MTCPGPVDRPDWILRYPPAIQTSLALLAAIVPEGQNAAANLLADDFPEGDALRREIEAIRARLAAEPGNTHLARRLEHLCRRLAEPLSVSDRRLEHLGAKLDRAIRHHVLKTWRADLRVPGSDGLPVAGRDHVSCMAERGATPAGFFRNPGIVRMGPRARHPFAPFAAWTAALESGRRTRQPAIHWPPAKLGDRSDRLARSAGAHVAGGQERPPRAISFRA